MMDVFRIRFQLTDVAAATDASLVAGFNEKSIRKWRHEFYEGNGDFPESERGKLIQTFQKKQRLFFNLVHKVIATGTMNTSLHN